MAARRLTGFSGKQVVRVLQKAGFDVLRVSGSHHVLRLPGPPRVTVIVPVHGARDLPPGTVRSILEQSGLTIDEFIALL